MNKVQILHLTSKNNELVYVFILSLLSKIIVMRNVQFYLLSRHTHTNYDYEIHLVKPMIIQHEKKCPTFLHILALPSG